MFERIRRLLMRGEDEGPHEDEGPRVDVGPTFGQQGATPLSDEGLTEDSKTVGRLPSRDYIGAEPEDLAPDPEADAQRWEYERELYEQKNDDSSTI